MSRGLRNNNPGNLRRSEERFQGEVIPSRDPAFKEFRTMAHGYRAMFRLLYTYQRKYGLRTIRGMIERYAPPKENDTESYIQAVSRWSGVGADSPIHATAKEVMVPIVAAMSRVENGVPALMREVEAGWNLFMGIEG